ncbi:MAG: response regulator [Candidatus Contendobacter sp.]|nr:response regulator [Candidatus Contendobacter sp.]RUQ28905.1 MAG: response regulator [Candidatus Competibacteraceae bacterium]
MSKRLLIVDDEPDFGEFVRQVAQTLGYKVMVTTNGRDFQQGYNDFQPNLILLDMVMPDMDGNEVLLWLLQKGYSAGLIITTGYSPDYAQEAKTLAEFNGLQKVSTLTKPVRSIELRSVLTRDEPLGPDHRPAAV